MILIATNALSMAMTPSTHYCCLNSSCLTRSSKMPENSSHFTSFQTSFILAFVYRHGLIWVRQTCAIWATLWKCRAFTKLAMQMSRIHTQQRHLAKFTSKWHCRQKRRFSFQRQTCRWIHRAHPDLLICLGWKARSRGSVGLLWLRRLWSLWSRIWEHRTVFGIPSFNYRHHRCSFHSKCFRIIFCFQNLLWFCERKWS